MMMMKVVTEEVGSDYKLSSVSGEKNRKTKQFFSSKVWAVKTLQHLPDGRRADDKFQL